MTTYDLFKPFYFFTVKYHKQIWENMIHYVKYPRTWIPATFPQVLMCAPQSWHLTPDITVRKRIRTVIVKVNEDRGSWTSQLLLSPRLTGLRRVSSFWFYSTPNPYTHFYAQTCVLKTQALMHPKAPFSFYTSSLLSQSIPSKNSECELTSFDCKRSLEILRANLSAPCGSPQSHWLHSWKKEGKRLREKKREKGRKRKVV